MSRGAGGYEAAKEEARLVPSLRPWGDTAT